MLSTRIASRFDRQMSSGKTWPCLLGVIDETEQETEVIAKFSAGCERGVTGLAVEAVTAMLAADLDLPIPEPFLVEFDDEFVRLIPLHAGPVATRISDSCRTAFALAKLPPGFVTIAPERPIPVDLRGAAADILAFDALIVNADRRPTNPNCLTNGRALAIFDHELSFMNDGILFWKPPWEPGSLDLMRRDVSQHVFLGELRGTKPDFQRLQGAWLAVTDQRLSEYRLALPEAWGEAAGTVDRVLGYIAEVRDHVGAALAEVSRVLA